MKPLPAKIILALALAGVSDAFAQTNNGVPGATDYAAFSRFVTDRNIFDPNRQPHYVSTRTRTRVTHTHVSAAAPAFTFVGTMNYQKGLFAFFSGNRDELKQVLPVAQKIAGYTVTKITPGGVTLETTNQADKLTLKVGDVVRQENGKWEWAGADEISASTSVNAPVAGGTSGTEIPVAAPSSALGQNDVLKRLMEKKAKELQ